MCRYTVNVLRMVEHYAMSYRSLNFRSFNFQRINVNKLHRSIIYNPWYGTILATTLDRNAANNMFNSKKINDSSRLTPFYTDGKGGELPKDKVYADRREWKEKGV